MSSLILPNKWTSQPQTPVGIDWSNPLTRGLCLGNTASLFNNAVNGAPPTRKTISVSNKAETVYSHANGEIVFSAPGIRAFVGRYLFDPTNERFGGMFSSTNRSGIYFEYTSSQLKAVVFNNGAWSTTNIGSTPATGALITLAVVSDSDTSHRVYRDGVLVATLTNTAQVSTFNVAGAMYCDASTFYTAAVKDVVGFAGFTSTPSNTEIKSLSDNPWQIFKPQARRIWVAAAGGGDALASNAAAQASASAAATTAIPITAAALSLSTAGGALTTAIPLNAVAAAIATSSGEMSTAITLQGGALAASSASGSLTTQILISGSALAQAVSSALLSSGITMTADAVAKAAVQGTLTTAIRMIANASGNASASAAFSGSPAALSAAAYSQATADAQLTISIQLAASALGQADAQGDLTTRVQLSAAALSSAIASGSLSVPVRFSANAFAQATASATLSDSAYISDPRYTATILGREFYVSSFERKFYAARKEVGTGYTVSIAKR
jgi:hypothetical protein